MRDGVGPAECLVNARGAEFLRLSTRHVELVETLAEEVAALAFADPRVASAIIDVRKTEIIPEAKGVGVIIHRQRGSARGAGLADAD